MISNFDEVKKQLSELSEVINKFKSEAVQLRIVEIVLGDGTYHEQDNEPSMAVPDKRSKSRRRKPTRSKSAPKGDNDSSIEKSVKKSRSSGQGAVAALSELVASGFFKQPRTISDIVDHCEKKLARRFKTNEFSGKLGRLTRDRVLDREKNGDNQYEYTEA